MDRRTSSGRTGTGSAPVRTGLKPRAMEGKPPKGDWGSSKVRAAEPALAGFPLAARAFRPVWRIGTLSRVGTFPGRRTGTFAARRAVGRAALHLSLSTIAMLAVACGTPPPPEPEAADEPRPPVETRSRVDRAVATTGDVITYSVTVDYDPAYEVEIPEPGAEIAGFRIIDVGREEPRDVRGRRVEERWYKLRADLVGSYVLPPVTVTYREAGPPDGPAEGVEEAGAAEAGEAEAQTVETSEIFIEVESVLPADGEVTDIRDLKPLRQIERPAPWWWYAAAGAAVVLALAAFLLWRRRREPAAAPPRPAHEIAFEALERLRHTDFDDLDAMRRFHFEISEVVRAYVEGRFGLNATDLTTEEIFDHLGELAELDGESNRRLRLFLIATDRVKFAAHEPPEEEIGETYEGALSFVEATRERPPATVPEEKAA